MSEDLNKLAAEFNANAPYGFNHRRPTHTPGALCGCTPPCSPGGITIQEVTKAYETIRNHNPIPTTVEASIIRRIEDILNNEVAPGRSIAAHQDVQLARIREALLPDSERQPDA